MTLRSLGFSSLVLLGVLGCSASLVGGCSGGAESSGGGGDDDPTGGSGASTATTSSSGGGQGGQGGEACVPEAEACDGLDNDCNGTVDDGCDCLPGATQSCYSGRPAASAGVGTCKAGTQTCDSTGHWGGCAGEVVPAAESCDGADSDCNGTPDDGIADIACGVGVCMALVPGCVNGSVPTCTPNLPSIEMCDGLDNDCDQLTDEADPNLGMVCDSGIPGICAAGVNQCLAGLLTCVPKPDARAHGDLRRPRQRLQRSDRRRRPGDGGRLLDGVSGRLLRGQDPVPGRCGRLFPHHARLRGGV